MINLIINIFYPSARSTWLAIAVTTALILSACQPQVVSISSGASAFGEDQLQNPETVPLAQESSSDQSPVTTFPKRPRYSPGQLVDYTAQPGDTLPFLAVRFNTTVEGILEANPFIPQSATTMPPGMPMQIPIYYLPLWGSPYQMIPDSLFVNGPSQVNFNTREFVAQNPGWLKNYKSFAGRANRSGAEIVDLVARNYSVSPLLLLALLEYQSEALSQPVMSTVQLPSV
jgi:LysM repeat protein